MGSSNSKRQGSFNRSSSVRQTQTKSLTRIKNNLTRIAEQIKRSDIIHGEVLHLELETELTNIQAALDAMKDVVKRNNANKYEYLLLKCEDERKHLESSVSKIDKSTQNVELKLLQIVVDKSEKLKHDVRSLPKSMHLPVDDNEEIESSLQNIQALRQGIENVKPKIYLFADSSNSTSYNFLLAEINAIKNHLVKVDPIEQPHIKHEKKMALVDVEACLKLLEEKVAFNESSPSSAEIHNAKASQNRSPHSANSDSDPDYDFVNTEDEDMTHKPVTVTSF